MAGRKDKNTVDYFPHYCISGKTMFILESAHGHLGYSVWFKTLELLGSSANHYIDLRDDTDLLFLISKMKITETELNNIYDLLAKLGAIDLLLWSNRIVFSENFIDNISDAYKRRSGDLCMNKFNLCIHLSISCGHKSEDSTQKSTKKRILNKTKEDNIKEYNENVIFTFNSIKPFFDKVEYSKSDYEKSLETIDKMIRLDKHTEQEIIEVLSLKSQSFYGANIQSIQALRTTKEGTTKFNKLKTYLTQQINNAENKRNSKNRGATDNELKALIREYFPE